MLIILPIISLKNIEYSFNDKSSDQFKVDFSFSKNIKVFNNISSFK